MDIESGLAIVSGKSFTNERVDIDGIEFVDCSFTDCVLVFSGGLPWLFTNTPLFRSSIHFDGKAEGALHALSAAYASGMGAWVEQIFDLIRGGTFVRRH